MSDDDDEPDEIPGETTQQRRLRWEDRAARAKSLAMHEAARARDAELTGQIATLREEQRTLQSTVEVTATSLTQLVEAVSGRDGLRASLDRMRGAIWAGAIIAGLVSTGVGAIVAMVIASDRTIAVHESEIESLHRADDESKAERRELRESVTRAASTVERVAEVVEAVDERVDRVEDEQRASARGGR
jgi:chromosome segregation ATPase